jgi:hypothetical protein
MEVAELATKKEWRESTNGPDVLDCAVMMKAIETLHSAHVAVIVSPGGTGSGTPVDVGVSALFETLPGSALEGGVVAHSEWPDKDGRSFWGLVYDLCWKLDQEVSKVYKNESLWK